MSIREGLGGAPSNLTFPLTEAGVSGGAAQPERSHVESANAASEHVEISDNFNLIQNLLSGLKMTQELEEMAAELSPQTSSLFLRLNKLRVSPMVA